MAGVDVSGMEMAEMQAAEAGERREHTKNQAEDEADEI
jgi:hypothetical protein